jgi:hypothetical protein
LLKRQRLGEDVISHAYALERMEASTVTVADADDPPHLAAVR